MRYLLGVVLCLQSYSSLAADWHENIFVGASIGTYEVDAGNVVVIGGGIDTDDGVARLNVGYQINRFIGLDVQFERFFSSSNGSDGAEVGLDGRGFDVGAVLSVPIVNRLDLFGRLGWNHASFDVTGLGVTESDHDSQLSWGIGAAYVLTENHSLRLETSGMDFVHGEVSGDIQFTSLGYTYKFGR